MTLAEISSSTVSDRFNVNGPSSLTKPGTIAALVDLYYRSRKWNGLSEGSKRTYRYILEPFVAEHGHRRVDQMEAKHVDALMDAKVATPVAANRLRKLLSVLMRIAIRQGWRKDNPVIAIENFKIRSKGHPHMDSR